MRPGHWRSVRAMQEDGFRAIVELFDSHPDTGGAYLRVVEQGFQPVDLLSTSQKPMIGIGRAFPATATLDTLRWEMSGRIDLLTRARRSGSKSAEKALEARLVRAALRERLRLHVLSTDLRFIASQWRIDLGGRGCPLDLICADVESGALVVVELKPEPDRAAIAQTRRYVDAIRAWEPEAFNVFSELAAAMAAVYGCDDMPPTFGASTVSGLAAWPIGAGAFHVEPVA